MGERAIAELFQTDPLELTDPDLGRMVKHLKAKRLTWEQEEQEAKATGKKPKSEKAKLEDLKDLDLGDLS